MRLVIMAAGAAVALCGCSGGAQSDNNATTNLEVGNLIVENSSTMNGMATDMNAMNSDTHNMMMNDLATNEADTNLANGT